MIELKNVNVNFNDRNVLSNINLKIKDKNYICLIGQSGCGKTTLLNVISGMLKPTEGEVIIDSANIYDDLNEDKRTLLRNNTIGYLNYGNSLLESLTIYENVLYPLLIQGGKNDEKIHQILSKLKIDNISNSYPNKISAGEYRRACFARVLALDTKIYLLDEPTSNLDDESAKIIIDIIKQLKKDKTIIIATHDKNLMNGKVIEIVNDKKIERKK